MEKRILVAFLLSVAVLFGFRTFFAPKTPPVAVSSPGQTEAPRTSTPAATPPVVVASIAQADSPTVPSVEGEIKAEKPEEARFDTPLYSALLTNHGAVLKSFSFADSTGKPTELIDAASAAKLGWPLALATADPKLDEILSNANFRMIREGTRLTMEYAGSGVQARKVLEFDSSNYEFSVVASVTRDGKPVPHNIAWQGSFGDQSIPPDATMRQVVYPDGTSYKTVLITGINEPQAVTVGRVGVVDQYFLAMFLLPGSGGMVKISKQEFTGSDGKVAVASQLLVPSVEQPIRMYIGPKDPKWLAKADAQLPGIISYGFFGFIAKPLTAGLLVIHSYIGNFGWAIILLTVVINLVLFPLRLKQQVSMQKMQKVQPQMRTLQDKYKKLKANDPKRVEVQSQMMSLYKEHGINPMSGCVPLLLQMPVLFAFWTMLSVSFELRQAPWILWITDLSRFDPYYVMPILMAASMLITQKMTPTTVDPVQAKMMMIMPLMFTVLFLSSPSGLMLYWITSNVVGIGQQFVINKYWAPAGAAVSKS